MKLFFFFIIIGLSLFFVIPEVIAQGYFLVNLETFLREAFPSGAEYFALAIKFARTIYIACFVINLLPFIQSENWFKLRKPALMVLAMILFDGVTYCTLPN